MKVTVVVCEIMGQMRVKTKLGSLTQAQVHDEFKDEDPQAKHIHAFYQDIPLNLVTGYSNKEEGFAIITDKSLSELAASFQVHCQHKRVEIKEGECDWYKGFMDFFLWGDEWDLSEITLEDWICMIDEPGYSVHQVYSTPIEDDGTAADAVCW